MHKERCVFNIKNAHYSIRTKLSLINILVALSCIALLGFAFYAQHRTQQSFTESQQYESALNNYYVIEAKIIEALIAEKDFAATHSESLISKQQQLNTFLIGLNKVVSLNGFNTF